MKILITGATGLLGRAIHRELKNIKTFTVLGTSFSRTSKEFRKLDVLNKNDINELLVEYKPDFIIHCAAERRPDVCKDNPEKAEKLNVDSVRDMVKLADEYGSRILYLSTDYVFDGRNPPYAIDALPNPLNFYGKMKLAGEKIIESSSGKHIILRVPILYGPVEYLAESAVTLIAEKLLSLKISSHDDDAIRFPTNTEDIAYIISRLLILIGDGQSIEGIFHWSSDHGYTKYEIARLMSEILKISESNILRAKPDPNAAPRPHNSHLDNSSIKSLGIERESDFKESVNNILQSHITI